jgi:hypothetical protein
MGTRKKEEFGSEGWGKLGSGMLERKGIILDFGNIIGGTGHPLPLSLPSLC